MFKLIYSQYQLQQCSNSWCLNDQSYVTNEKMEFSLRRIMHYQKKKKRFTLLGWQGIVVSFVIRKKLASCSRPLPFLAGRNTSCAKLLTWEQVLSHKWPNRIAETCGFLKELLHRAMYQVAVILWIIFILISPNWNNHISDLSMLSNYSFFKGTRKSFPVNYRTIAQWENSHRIWAAQTELESWQTHL